MITILIAIIIIAVLWSVWGYVSSRVEQADYTVLQSMNGYEIREYPAHIVAQTTVQGAQREAMSTGFRIVAGYIFGANTKKESIAMTAPVVAEKSSESIAMTAPVVATTKVTHRLYRLVCHAHIRWTRYQHPLIQELRL
jgi:hypothetical protein